MPRNHKSNPVTTDNYLQECPGCGVEHPIHFSYMVEPPDQSVGIRYPMVDNFQQEPVQCMCGVRVKLSKQAIANIKDKALDHYNDCKREYEEGPER